MNTTSLCRWLACSTFAFSAAVLAVSREYQIGRIYEPVYLCRRWDGNSDAGIDVAKQNAFNFYKDKIRTFEILARQRKNAMTMAAKKKTGATTMTKTKTSDVAGTVAQIVAATEAGCDIVRVTVNDKEAAEAIAPESAPAAAAPVPAAEPQAPVPEAEPALAEPVTEVSDTPPPETPAAPPPEEEATDEPG